MFQYSSSFLRIRSILISTPASQSVQDSLPAIPGNSGINSESDQMPFISTTLVTIKFIFSTVRRFKGSGEYQATSRVSPIPASMSSESHLFITIPFPSGTPSYKEGSRPEINEYGADLFPFVMLFARYVITG